MAEEGTSMETVPAPEESWGEDISPDNDGMLFKKIIEEGEGDERPGKGNNVFVHYTGRLLDGTVFDSSVSRNELFNFKLGQGSVIKGWDVGVATMRKGEKCLLTCKPDFAYGSSGSGDAIPPDSTLQFEVELFYWEGDDITNDGGVILYVLEEGTGWKKPSDGSSVKVHLKGTCDGNVIEDREVEFDLGEGSEYSVIEGVEKGIEKMKEKEKVKLVIKPKYAFGSAGDSNKGVPPNAEVIYIVTLISFVKAKSSYEYDNVEERITDATALKDKGTSYFKSSKFPLALKVYKRGLGIVDKSSVYKEEEKTATSQLRVLLQLNMAACHLKLDSAVEARECCEKVIEEDKDNIKAHFRKGQAYQMIQDFEEAIQCFQEVVKLEANNRSAQVQIQECRKKIRQQLEKDKKMYSNMFKSTTSTSSAKKSSENEDESVKKDSPVKDAIAQAVEEESEKMELTED